MFKINMEELVPLIKEVIDSGAVFRLYPRGESMLPTICQGEDSVDLAKPSELKKYDIVLYQRECGKYVLHRIVNIRGDLCDMCGDNQLEIEKDIPASSIIAFVPYLYKGEKMIDTSDKGYLNKIKILYLKKSGHRLISKIKKLIYPAYRLICKK